MTNKCIENEVYTQELFSVLDGEMIADVVFLPAAHLKKLSIASFSDGFFGFLVFKLNEARKAIGLQIIDISITGKNKSGGALSNVSSTYFLLQKDLFAQLENYNTSIVTNQKYLLLLLSHSTLAGNSDFHLSLNEKKMRANWTIRFNSKEYEKFSNLFK